MDRSPFIIIVASGGDIDMKGGFTMKVFVAGSTGVLGRRIARDLTERGHQVMGLTRGERGDELIESLGAQPVRGDLFDAQSMTEATQGADVLIHAATAIPTKTKPSLDDWRENDRIRTEGTDALIRAATTVGASKLVLQSIVWVARQPDGSWFDEDAMPHPDRTAESMLVAERQAQHAAEEQGLEVAILRCGLFHAPDAAHTRLYGELLQQGKLPIVGGGPLGRRDALLSHVHVDDAARAFVAATESEQAGLWHVVDDEPATIADLFKHVAELLDAPRPSRIPGWLAKAVIGPDSVKLLTHSMPTTNQRIGRDLGWAPAYPTYRESYAQIVRAWHSGAIADEPVVAR
ncbi:MAG: NAD-dependent epimerase/dehydratase family protein [Salinibacter sp.]